METTDRSETSVSLPASFLQELLTQTTDLRELKAVLVVASLAVETGAPSVALDRLTEPDAVRAIAGRGSPEPGVEHVKKALDRAVVNGRLLRMRVLDGNDDTVRYLVATPRSRELRWASLPAGPGPDRQP